MNIRRILIPILITILASSAFAEIVKPKKGGKFTLMDSRGKEYKYWIVDKNKEIQFEIQGIANAKIYVRSEMGEKVELTVNVDDYKVKVFTIEEEKSQIAKAEGFKNLTRAKVITVIMPKGKHTLSMKPDKKVIIRISSVKKKTYITMAPHRHDGGLVLISADEEFAYYQTTPKKAVEYNILGEGTVTLYTRLIYTSEMMGVQKYKLRVQFDEEDPTTYEFETVNSTVSYFRNDGKIIPGKAQKIKLKIPKGKHNLKMFTEDSNTVALRLMLPMSMIKN